MQIDLIAIKTAQMLGLLIEHQATGMLYSEPLRRADLCLEGIAALMGKSVSEIEEQPEENPDEQRGYDEAREALA